MKCVLSGVVLVVAASAKDLLNFESFVELHARKYRRGSTEFEQRKALYQQRLTDAERHNRASDKIWTAGVNKLWDWTESELQTLRGWDGANMPDGGHSRSISRHAAFLQQKADLPKEKMWETLETFAYTKNQAACGSCWAIASSTVLEAHNEIYNKNHRIFSTQQIVDCTPNPRHCGGEGGCKGATAELAMEWVLKNGLQNASERPYTGQDEACVRAPSVMAHLGTDAARSSQTGAAFGMVGWSTLPKNEYEPLVRALAEVGPVAVSVAAGQWFAYEAGIFNGCPKDNVIDHAVVAMGYGEEAGNKYWIIQNSWGQDWGENGFIRMFRHAEGGYCGMNNDPQKGVACKGETKPVPVCGMCGVLFDSVIPHFKGALAAIK